ncbi:immunoglobulin kappa light chain-like [Archocentrus centrarchus]|uniref:immunoglobulin kappa light chain-like n=1 Tax=Archocentrus centrarchus TaxID=63155 RepID=UPI0011EA2BAC|nr:immunoglobulin kappa light chain-like [Archocentrus centrarchus]
MMVSILSIVQLCSLCEALLSDISQPVSFQAVNLGDAVTITCHIQHVASRMRVWYKLTSGRRLQLVASTDTLYNLTTFKEPTRHFLVKSESFKSHLTISKTTREDTGTYYCGVLTLNNVQFGQGTFLFIKGTNLISDSVIQQPESQTAQSGDYVTLTCSVHAAQCAPEHTSVMWLKNSGYSAPEMIYASGYENNTCQWTESGKTICVYTLSLDDAGVYYCAVTSCGHTMFGNGTRIKIHNAGLIKSLDVSPTFIVLLLSNFILGLATLLLLWAHCKNHRKEAASM